MPVTDTVDQYLQTLEADVRRVSETEWGLTVDAAGWPLHIGVAWRDGLLRAQGEVLGPDAVSDHELLFRNRGLVFVRFAHTSAGDVYVHGELPPELVSASWLDRLLGMLVDAAVVARHRAQSTRASDATTSSGSSAS
jgi:hypothetical protein